MKEEVLHANRQLITSGLVKLTWGNASAIDRVSGRVYIKPSGVSYAELAPEWIAEVSVESGQLVSGRKPSSDTPTHLLLYQSFPQIGGVVHTHSPWATMWAQACREIPCLGTTHADYFYGSIPVTRVLTQEEIGEEYEENTGKVIAECFSGIDPLDIPGVLVAQHGPFTWGRTVDEAVQHAIILEEVAKMAWHTLLLGREEPVSKGLLNKHFRRKHGPDAYYGQ